MKKTMKNIKVFEEDCEFDLPAKPDEFIKFFQDKFDLVPEEYKATTEIEVETEQHYDCCNLNITIFYRRIETDKELEAREQKVKQQQEFKENQELCELERLKKKFNV